MSAFYNEFEPYAAQWIRNLIAAGLIPPGDVDERSIAEVQPDDLRGYTQCHFFAGLAGWPFALRLAGWDDARPIWTGSCPCQPFSVAGKGAGKNDPRHLWPDFFRLIEARRPAIVMGEQVAGSAGEDWFDGVAADLERVDYAARAVDIPAAAVDAPHIRQRLYWCAMGGAERQRLQGRAGGGMPSEWRASPESASGCKGYAGENSDDVANPNQSRRGWWAEYGDRFAHGEDGRWPEDNCEPVGRREDGDDMADTDSGLHDRGRNAGPSRRPEYPNGCSLFWSNSEWLTGADGKARRAKPGIRLLASRVPARASKLRAIGNAICAPLAAEVVKALMETLP